MQIHAAKNMTEALETSYEQTLATMIKLTDGDQRLSNYIRVHAGRHLHTLETLCKRGALQGKVLDLGAAPFFLSECLTRMGVDTTAADYDPTQWKFRDQLSCPIVSLDCDGKRFDLPDSEFDVIIMTEVFEHLRQDLIFTAQEILRVLRPGGILYLTTPNLFSLRKLSKIARKGYINNLHAEYRNLKELGYMGHVREYTPREIEMFFEACGYSSIDVWTANVYSKSSGFAWRVVTAGLPRMRETICGVMSKPLKPTLAVKYAEEHFSPAKAA
ncbi:class I SAM-dependent methyltransferase [Bythopirellula polymerisocia]|uniref:Bifunctional 3-demethylubiquinone-9 3-methyltransferase/ 2-octaprenyl-6-hydroxy phenol methylase n=1 Tax=Bythopirellula polymerisocia TaxID=2528003 RepID=A0A5C6CWD5_9BACT|nr:class I SAM-dependent methyltransferase [Bythopirellula polymerisocia]TWU28175.1 bifunctional 3-demethylubiquinone-9 3-methyltransferase/ 2-octaprenyl-6-hydroxy phenol methylase [Bythopirellula polymerisocia]